MNLVELERRLTQQGFVVDHQNASTPLFFASKRTFKWRWFATWLTVYVVANQVPRVDVAGWATHEQAARALAASRWTGMRGMQQGYAVLAILLADAADAQTLQVVGGPVGLEFSRMTVRAMRLKSGVVASRFPRFIGSIYRGYLRGLGQTLLG